MTDLGNYQWVMTDVRPGTPATGYDAGRRSWKWHAVEASSTDSFAAIRHHRAACGLRARHGWTMDLFAHDDDRCTRCEKALGIPPSPWNALVARTKKRLSEGSSQ